MKEQSPLPAALLERATSRVSSEDTFVAGTFRAWCGPQLDLDAVAAGLGCSREAAVRAALCRYPRSDSFQADVQAIANASGIDSQRLAAMLREGASLAAFRRGPTQRMLAAARDAPDEPEEPK